MLIPRDDNNKELQLTPNTSSLSTKEISLTTIATDITLEDRTDLIEIQADASDIYLKYGIGATAIDNGYDEKIKAGFLRHYVIPKNITSISLITKIDGTCTLIQK